MTRGVILPLETARLTDYAVPIACYICAGPNNFEAEHCRFCLAPMALAHQAEKTEAPPTMVGVVGMSGVGKTVYLGMLIDMLSRGSGDTRMLARGAFSVNLQQSTVGALARCGFPDKTPSEPDRWDWVHCQVRTKGLRKQLDLIIPDMAGESLAEEIDHPQSFRIINSFFRKCSALLILVDAVRLVESGYEEEFFNMKLTSYLGELVSNRGSHWSKRPVGIVFTKADQHERCMEDPEGFVKAHAMGFWEQCRERFRSHKFFGAKVAGTCAWRDTCDRGRVQVPLRVEPHGIVEPFEWLLAQLKKIKRLA